MFAGPALEQCVEGIDLARRHQRPDTDAQRHAAHLVQPISPGAERIAGAHILQISGIGADGLGDGGLAEIAVPGPRGDGAAAGLAAFGTALGLAEPNPLQTFETTREAIRYLPPGRQCPRAGRAELRQQCLLHQKRDIAGLGNLGRADTHVDQPEQNGVGVVDVDGGPDLVAGIDALEDLAGGIGVADLRDHARGGMNTAEMHQCVLVVSGPGLSGARRGHRDLDRAGDAVFDRILEGDEVELPVHLGHLQGEVDGHRGGLAVAGAPADEDAALHGHAYLGEQRRLGVGEAKPLQGHALVEAVAVEQAGEQVVGVGLMGAALAAQRRDPARQRHRTAGPDGESLE